MNEQDRMAIETLEFHIGMALDDIKATKGVTGDGTVATRLWFRLNRLTHEAKMFIAYARKQQDLKNVVCPQCGKVFRLTWNDYSDTPETLVLRGCPSGGIYDVKISCPHCDYEEEL